MLPGLSDAYSTLGITKNKVDYSLICSAFIITTPASQFYWAPYSQCAILIGGILSVLNWPRILLPQLADKNSYCTILPCHFQSNFDHICVRTARLGWFLSGNLTTFFPMASLRQHGLCLNNLFFSICYLAFHSFIFNYWRQALLKHYFMY